MQFQYHGEEKIIFMGGSMALALLSLVPSLPRGHPLGEREFAAHFS